MDKRQPLSLQAQKSEKTDRRMWRPQASPVNDASQECPFCGGLLKSTFVICPHCGKSLTPGKCSFCGTVMKEKARFCSRCGQSGEGIICPDCGTLNSRNFCRKCNAPLTLMAQNALAAAKDDPVFQILQTKAEYLSRLHAQIENLRNVSAKQQSRLSDADRALIDEYADLLGSIGAYTPAVRIPQNESGSCNDTAFSIDEIMTAYREKAKEMNEALKALTPPPDFTPEQQRDYFSARKIATVTTEYDLSGYRPSQWRCNYCGYMHGSPTECAEPQLGGTWIYQTPEEYIANHSGIIDSTSSLQIS